MEEIRIPVQLLHNPVMLLLSFIPALFVALAVARKNKTVAALAQLGGVQERESQREDLKNAVVEVDKLWFLLSTMNLALTPYILGAAPTFYFLYFTPKIVMLIALRWWSFKKRGQHYFLWDFCYWANALCLYYVWVDPTNPLLFQTLFMCANGPVAFSILCFNHAMIFHSFPHVTSSVIHLSPAILSYGLRWHVDRDDRRFVVCPHDDDGGCAGVGYLSLVSAGIFGFYIWWCIIYYVWIFVVLGNRIERKGYVILWDRFLGMKPWGPPLQKLVVTQGKLVAQAAYLCLHLGLTTLTMLVVALMWYSQVAHFVFVITLVGSTLWNGAAFYLSVFESHYSKILTEKAVGIRPLYLIGVLSLD